MKRYFIYKYTFPNNKVYIGQTYEGSYRYGEISQYRRQIVYRAMLKYPEYQKEILQYCNESEVDELERYYIEKYKANQKEFGYNCESGGSLNKHMSEESKKKISEANKGRICFWKGKCMSDETKKKISNSLKANKHMVGTHLSEETRRKIASALSIPVICEELNKEFPSAIEAARQLGINKGNINSCLKGKRSTCGGYHFRYKEGDQ